MEAKNEGQQRVPRSVQVSVSVVAILIGLLIFLGGRESAQSEIEAVSRNVGIQQKDIERNADDIKEIETIIKENQNEIKLDMKEQRRMIQDIHTIILENNGD